MTQRCSPRGLRVLALGATASLGAAASAQVAYSVSGANVSDLLPVVNQFRTDLGALNPNVAGSFGSGRREINWDAVPNGFAAPNNLPANFFNVNSPRGAVFSTSGTGFQVSANSGSGPINFGNINASYTTTFGQFSAQRLFTALGSNVMDVTFFVPGSSTPGRVTGFGAVFTDVDLADSTSIEFFDASNTSIYRAFALPGTTANASFSFLGARFNSAVVSRVRITSGTVALGPNDNPLGGADVVAMDDFIYGEPVPEPLSLAVLGMGVALAARRRRSGTK